MINQQAKKDSATNITSLLFGDDEDEDNEDIIQDDTMNTTTISTTATTSSSMLSSSSMKNLRNIKVGTIDSFQGQDVGYLRPRKAGFCRTFTTHLRHMCRVTAQTRCGASARREARRGTSAPARCPTSQCTRPLRIPVATPRARPHAICAARQSQQGSYISVTKGDTMQQQRHEYAHAADR